MVRFLIFLSILLVVTVTFAQAPPPPGSGPGISMNAPLRIMSVQPQDVVYTETTIFFVVTGTVYSEYSAHTGGILPPPGYVQEAAEFQMTKTGPQTYSFTAGLAIQLPGNGEDDAMLAIIAMNARTPNLGVMAVPTGAAATATIGF